MTVPFQGGCRCGAIRYEVTAEPLAVVDCHCRDCQYASGGSHATVVVVSKEAFRLLTGTPKTFATRADSGNTTIRHFCPDCGTPLFGEASGGPMWTVKAASLDDPSGLKVMAAVFVKSAQPWALIPSELPKFGTLPPDPQRMKRERS